MNILYILNFAGLNKPKTGAQNRFFNLTEQLKRNNNIFVLESRDFIDSNDLVIGNVYYYDDLKILRYTLSIFRDINISYILYLIWLLKKERIDIILISHPNGSIAVKLITKLIRKEIPIIYDAHNVESNFIKESMIENSLLKKIIKKVMVIYIYFLESFTSKYIFNHIISVSNCERDIFIHKYNLYEKKVSVIPSGCVIRKKSIRDIDKIKIREKYGLNNKIIVFFHGLYSHFPNRESMELIKKYIAPKFEDDDRILFLMCGSRAPEYELKNVKSIGFIDNLEELLSIVDIAIIPLRKGAGTKLKIFDYMSFGIPIITTKKGIEGIEAENLKQVIIVNEVDNEFIDAISYLIEKEKERNKIGENGRKLAEDVYDWNKIGNKLNNIFQDIAEEQFNEIE